MLKERVRAARATNAEMHLNVNLVNNKSLEIINLTKKYINSACYVFSRNFHHITMDDLKQECCIKILEIVRKHPASEIKDLVEISKTAVYNMLKDIYRKEKYRQHEKIYMETDDEGTIDNILDDSYDSESFIDRIGIVMELEKRISETDRQVLHMILSPDLQLIEIIQNNNKKAVEESKSGKLKMNVHKVKMTSKSIAQRLSISPATVSRSLGKITLITSELLSDGESEVSY